MAHETWTPAPGARVRVVDGISTGAVGTILRDEGLAPLGMRIWLVDLDGIRARGIREDFLRSLEVSPRESQPPPNKLPRGRCPVCGSLVALRKGGQIREHRKPPGLHYLCGGTGRVVQAEVPR